MSRLLRDPRSNVHSDRMTLEMLRMGGVTDMGMESHVTLSFLACSRVSFDTATILDSIFARRSRLLLRNVYRLDLTFDMVHLCGTKL